MFVFIQLLLGIPKFFSASIAIDVNLELIAAFLTALGTTSALHLMYQKYPPNTIKGERRPVVNCALVALFSFGAQLSLAMGTDLFNLSPGLRLIISISSIIVFVLVFLNRNGLQKSNAPSYSNGISVRSEKLLNLPLKLRTIAPATPHLFAFTNCFFLTAAILLLQSILGATVPETNPQSYLQEIPTIGHRLLYLPTLLPAITFFATFISSVSWMTSLRSLRPLPLSPRRLSAYLLSIPILGASGTIISWIFIQLFTDLGSDSRFIPWLLLAPSSSVLASVLIFHLPHAWITLISIFAAYGSVFVPLSMTSGNKIELALNPTLAFLFSASLTALAFYLMQMRLLKHSSIYKLEALTSKSHRT
jgi:hypothetical protein